MEESFAGEFDAAGLDEWKALAGDGDLRTTLSDGVIIDPLHAPAVALPIGVPFREGPWTVCQRYADPRMDVCATQIRDDLAGGVEAVWLVGGLDHGTRILTPGDLELVLEHVDLRSIPVYLEPEADALCIGMSLIALAESRGVPLTQLRGGLGVDPLGTLARSGSLVSGWRGATHELTELAVFSSENGPGLRALLVSTAPYADAGASPTQEIAWAVASGLEYIRLLRDVGFTLERALAELQFAVSVSPALFGEVAKLRALRWVWAKAMAAAGVMPTERRMALHARSSIAHRSRQDPWVNMLRGTAETFAAAIGGADSIATLAFDAAVGPSDALALRVARNSQLVLREESHLHAVDDPAAGSGTIEAMTEALAREAWSLFQNIERKGGMARALRTGRISGALDARREAHLASSAKREEELVGVSVYPTLEGRPVERTQIDLEDVEVELGNAFSDATSDQRHESLLAFAQTLQDRTAPPGSLASAALAAARLGVDIFSLGKLLRLGRPSVHLEPLRPLREAALWESLRDAGEKYAQQHSRLHAEVATLGERSQYSERLTWVTQLLAAVGIEAVARDEVHDRVSAVDAMAQSDAPIAVICGPDELYASEVPDLAADLKAKGAKLVLVVGDPKERHDAYRKRGVDAFLFQGEDLHASLTRVLRVLGVML